MPTDDMTRGTPAWSLPWGDPVRIDLDDIASEESDAIDDLLERLMRAHGVWYEREEEEPS